MKFAVFLFIALFYSCYDCRNNYRISYNEEYKVLIDSVFENMRNHASPTIHGYSVSEEYLFVVDDIPLFFESARKGDSLLKAANSYKYILKRKDTIMEFYPRCDGETLK